MIDAITIQHDELQKFCQFKYAFDFVLNFGNGTADGARAILVSFGCYALAGRIRQKRAFGCRWQVGSDTGYDHSTLESLLEKIENGLLHHVSDFEAFQRWSNYDNWSHWWHNFVNRYLTHLGNKKKEFQSKAFRVGSQNLCDNNLFVEKIRLFRFRACVLSIWTTLQEIVEIICVRIRCRICRIVLSQIVVVGICSFFVLFQWTAFLLCVFQCSLIIRWINCIKTWVFFFLLNEK
jgi:hypothetical protein